MRQSSLVRPPVGWLALPSLLLFAFFILPAPQYRNTSPLFMAREAEGKKAPESGADIPVQVRSLEGTRAAQAAGEVADPSKAFLSRQRVGMNILARSGYLHSANAYQPFPVPSATAYRVRVIPEVEQCTALEAGPSDETNRAGRARHLAFAAVAVEKFNRNAVQRGGERLFGRLIFTVAGEYPDLSYGPAQIRLSTVRQLGRMQVAGQGETPLSTATDPALVDLLMDECHALNITAHLMLAYLTQADLQCAQSEDENCAAKQAAARFNGRRRSTHAVLDYAPLVAEMAGMIE